MEWITESVGFISPDRESYTATDGTGEGYYGVVFVAYEYLAYHSEIVSWGNSYPTADAAKQACEQHAIEQITKRLLGER